MKRFLIAAMAALFISSCMTSQQTPAESPEDVVIEAGEVIFNGTDCSVTGESKLPPGKYSYVLQDESEYEAQLFIGRLLEGKTTQDMIDLQGEPGAYLPRQEYDEAFDYAVEPGSAKEKPDGRVHTYILNTEGEYTIGIWSYEMETVPVWFCAPLWIEEIPSE